MTEPSFELSYALEQAGDQHLLRELVKILLDEGSKKLAAVCSAAKGTDARELEAAAHSFKGAISVFGAKRLASTLEEVEQNARRGLVGENRTFVAEAEAQWHTLAAELEEWLVSSRP